MTVFGSFGHIQRIPPIHGDHSEEDSQGEKRRKKVLYQGRSWSETEDDIQMPPMLPVDDATDKEKKRPKTPIYADQLLLERAKSFFLALTTLEEKIAQLFFYQTKADYDTSLQNDLEEFIQGLQIGGILFTQGEYKRQSYLIEHYQSVSKTPLLFGNDFLHGLSFYFQGEIPPQVFKEGIDARRLSDLGKAVAVQNRRLGVHFQFDRERSHEAKIPLNDQQCKAFRKGIREAQGIVAKEKECVSKTAQSSKHLIFSSSTLIQSASEEQNIHEALGLRTLEFFDLTRPAGDIKELCKEAFNSSKEVFLISSDVSTVIQTLAQEVKEGRISEEELDRRVMKVLLVKAIFFKLD